MSSGLGPSPCHFFFFSRILYSLASKITKFQIFYPSPNLSPKIMLEIWHHSWHFLTFLSFISVHILKQSRAYFLFLSLCHTHAHTIYLVNTVYFVIKYFLNLHLSVLDHCPISVRLLSSLAWTIVI